MSVLFEFHVLGSFSFARVSPSSSRSSVSIRRKTYSSLLSDDAWKRTFGKDHRDLEVSKKKSLCGRIHLWWSYWIITDFRHLRFYGTRIYTILHTLHRYAQTIWYSESRVSSAAADYYRRTHLLSVYTFVVLYYPVNTFLSFYSFRSRLLLRKKVKQKKVAYAAKTYLLKSHIATKICG